MKSKFLVHTIEMGYGIAEGTEKFDAELAKYMNDGWNCASISHTDEHLVATCIKQVAVDEKHKDEKPQKVNVKIGDPFQ